MAGFGDKASRSLDCRIRRNGAKVRGHRLKPALTDSLAGNVFRKLKMDGARPLFERDAKSITDLSGNIPRINDLLCRFCNRLHSRHDVDDLKAALTALKDRLLARYHDHGHRAQKSIGRARHKICGPWPESAEAHAWFSCQPSIGCGHESGRLLVARNDQPYFGRSQRVKKIEIFLPWQSENNINALIFERLGQNLCTLQRSICHFRIFRMSVTQMRPMRRCRASKSTG